MLIRYLRARVDAWLPVGGRCVITIEDTDLLLNNKDRNLANEIIGNIPTMRLRALHNCHMGNSKKNSSLTICGES